MSDSGANAENLVGLDAARRERARATQEMAPGVGRRLAEIEGQLATLVAELALARVQRREEIAAVRRTSLREVPDQPAVPSVSEIAAEVAREVRAALGEDIRAALREVVAEARAEGTSTSAVVTSAAPSEPAPTAPIAPAPRPMASPVTPARAQARVAPVAPAQAPAIARAHSADALVADLLASIAPPAPVFVPPAAVPMREVAHAAAAFAPAIAPPAVLVTEAAAPAPVDVDASSGQRELQVVVSPLYSFAQMLDVEMRLRSFSSVTAMQLSDFRNGVATFTVSVAEAIVPSEFGAAVQMVEALRLRLEGSTSNRVELRVEEPPAAS